MIVIHRHRALRLRRLALTAAVLGGFLICRQGHAQVASTAVSLGFGIDTTEASTGDVVRLVRAYLARPDTSARSRGLWSTATDFDRRVGDLTMSHAYQGFPATIVSVASDGPGDSVYVVRVLYARADSTGANVSPLALQRLYAIREPDATFGFRLSGALPRLTRDWERRSKGRVTFWYAPGQHPNVEKISRSSRVVDSVATLFQVPPPSHIDMYLAGSLEEAERAIGLDFFPAASADQGRGGQAMFPGIVLVGTPSIGEGYVHEIVHVILGPTFPSRSRLFAEGAATWIGGSRGRTPRETYALLYQFQADHPAATLAQVLKDDVPDASARERTEAFYATAAVIVDSVYRLAGMAGLRALAQLKGDPNLLFAALPAQLGLNGSDQGALDLWWRTQTARLSGVR